MADEETRAELWRQQQTAQAAARAARARALAGSAPARKTLGNNWEPLYAAIEEARSDGGRDEERATAKPQGING